MHRQEDSLSQQFHSKIPQVLQLLIVVEVGEKLLLHLVRQWEAALRYLLLLAMEILPALNLV